MLQYIKQIWNTKDLRKKILFTVGILVFYRFLAHVTVPGASIEALQSSVNRNEFLAVFSLLTGGSTESFSIVLMGISPYVNASIIIQLLTVVIPGLENLSKEGEAGRRKLNAYTRWLTLPLGLLQSYGMIMLLNFQQGIPLIDTSSSIALFTAMLTITAGTVLLVWLGEQISERGIGNGISMIIFASILSQVPVYLGQSLSLVSLDTQRLIPLLIVILISLALTVIVVLVNEANRQIPITYGSGGAANKNNQSFLPIRINQAGMIPIIFAVAMISFPVLIGQFMQSAESGSLRELGLNLQAWLAPNTILYVVLYFLLVAGFTYFYVSITFKPQEIADNIQKRGGYVPGIRPGKETVDHIAGISHRLTFFGAIFLGAIAVLPIVVQLVMDRNASGSVPLLVSGAGIIIVVGVVLDVIRQINTQLVMHDYKKFY